MPNHGILYLMRWKEVRDWCKGTILSKYLSQKQTHKYHTEDNINPHYLSSCLVCSTSFSMNLYEIKRVITVHVEVDHKFIDDMKMKTVN